MGKNTVKTVGIILLAWLILPTGDPSDVITFSLIAAIGFNAYFVVSAIVIIILYNSIDGRTIGQKLNSVKKEIGKVIG
jgi:hypothetical protein